MAAAHVLRNSTADGDLLKNPVPLAAETVYPGHDSGALRADDKASTRTHEGAERGR